MSEYALFEVILSKNCWMYKKVIEIIEIKKKKMYYYRLLPSSSWSELLIKNKNKNLSRK